MIIKKLKTVFRNLIGTKKTLHKNIKLNAREVFIRERYNQRKISTRLFS